MHRLALRVAPQRHPRDRLSQLAARQRAGALEAVALTVRRLLKDCGNLTRHGCQRVQRVTALAFGGGDGVKLTLELVSASHQLIDPLAGRFELTEQCRAQPSELDSIARPGAHLTPTHLC